MKALKINIIAIGIAAIIAQVVILRESMVFFTGSELSIGAVLGCWLMFSAIGSISTSRISSRNSYTWFILFQFLLVIFLFLEIYLLRNARSLIGIQPGEILPLLDVLKYSLTLLFPLPFVVGGLFPLAVKTLDEMHETSNTDSVGSVYMLEVMGNIAGGLIVTLFLCNGISTLLTASLVIFLIVIVSIQYIVNALSKNNKSHATYMKICLLLICCLGVWYFSNIESIDTESRKSSFDDMNVVRTIDSRHGNITITKDRDQFNYFLNGSISFYSPAKLLSEESIHLPMLQRPDADSVLLIGGGMNGALDELLKYNINHIDYLEFDRLVVESAVDLMNSETLSSIYNNASEICKIHYGDPWRFIRNSDSDIYDVVIMNVPEPSDALSNRYFTYEYFRDIKRILKPSGVMSFGLTSEPNYIGPDLLAVNGNIYHTLKKVFDSILITPEDYNYFIATDTKDTISLDPYYLGEMLLEHDINTEYVDSYYLADRLDPDRIEFVIESYEDIINPGLNTLLNPHAYFDMLKLTAKKDYIGEESINAKSIWLAFAICIVIVLVSCAIYFKRVFRTTLPAIILFGVFVSGFALMSAEVILIYAYQSYVGYVFERIGIIIAIFMAGLACGAWIAGKAVKIKNTRFMWMSAAMFALLIYFILLYMMIPLLSVFHPSLIEVLLSAMILIPGFAGGFIFPIANSIYSDSVSDSSVSAGIVYASDLLGAMFGAILPSILIMPYFGLLTAIKAPLFLLVGVTLLLSMSRKE